MAISRKQKELRNLRWWKNDQTEDLLVEECPNFLELTGLQLKFPIRSWRAPQTSSSIYWDWLQTCDKVLVRDYKQNGPKLNKRPKKTSKFRIYTRIDGSKTKGNVVNIICRNFMTHAHMKGEVRLKVLLDSNYMKFHKVGQYSGQRAQNTPNKDQTLISPISYCRNSPILPMTFSRNPKISPMSYFRNPF